MIHIFSRYRLSEPDQGESRFATAKAEDRCSDKQSCVRTVCLMYAIFLA